jgi:ABC-type glutathione transport system ATPase component
MSIVMPVPDGPRASGRPRSDRSKRRRSKKKRPAPERNLLLEASDVHVRYRIRASRPVEQALRARRLPDSGRDTHAVRGVTLQVREGDCIGIIGSNGAGKSSLLRAIAGLEPLASGQLLAGCARLPPSPGCWTARNRVEPSGVNVQPQTSEPAGLLMTWRTWPRAGRGCAASTMCTTEAAGPNES